MALVSKLEDENRRLRDELQHKSDLDEKVERSSSKDSISMTKFTHTKRKSSVVLLPRCHSGRTSMHQKSNR